MQKMPSMPSGRNRSGAAKLRRQDASAGAGTIALALVLVSLVVFTLSVREGEGGFFGTVRGVTQTIASPVRLVGGYVTAPLASLGNVMRNLTADEQTLTELKEENERLSARNVELEEAQITAERLQSLLDLRDTHDLTSVAARVIAGSTDTWSSTITIDRGSASGLSIGMPVVSDNGAIGQIIACAANTSTVRLIDDESSSVSAMVQSSRAQGMLRGTLDGSLRLTLIRTDQTIDEGAIVVTSGLGGVFPKGIPIGKVSRIESTPGSAYYDIEVEPYSRVDSLEEVLVITSLTDSQKADETDIEDADAADHEAASGKSASQESEGDDESGEGSEEEQSDESATEDVAYGATYQDGAVAYDYGAQDMDGEGAYDDGEVT